MTETIGQLVVTLSMLIWAALMAAILGGAMAAGAWVVWRLLEKRASTPTRIPHRPRILSPGVLLGVALVGALWFAFALPAAMQRAYRPGGVNIREGMALSVLPFIPLLVLLSLAVAAVWLVRRVMARSNPT